MEAARPARARLSSPVWLRTAWAILAPLCVVGATVALLFHFGKGLGGRDAPSPGSSRDDPGRSQAFAACQRFIRGQVAPPSTLKSFSSGLVADESERYLVTGTAEVVDGTGFILRKRFSCKVRIAAGTGPVVEEGHLF